MDETGFSLTLGSTASLVAGIGTRRARLARSFSEDRWWFGCDHDFRIQLTELLVTEAEQVDFLIRAQQLRGNG